MSIFDKVGRIARRAGSAVQDTMGGLVDDAFMPDDARTALARAEAAIAHGEWDDALTELDKVEASKSGLMRTALLRGIAWLETGRETRAIHFLEKALQTRETIEGYYFLGLAYERATRLADARNALLAAVQQERDPSLSFDILSALGRVYLTMGRAELAVHELRRALQIRPAEPNVVTLLAAAMRREGRDRDAIALLQEHREQLVGPEPWVLLGQLLLANGDLSGARGAFDQALEIEERVDALEGAAVAAFDQGARDDARALLARARQIQGDSGRLRTLAGQLALSEGTHDDAIAHFDAALELAPHQTEALVGLGQAALLDGDAQRANDAFRRALAQAPDHVDALVGAGRARRLLGDRAAALRLLDTARAACPTAEVFIALAELARDAGDPLEAIVLLEHARQLDDTDAAHVDTVLAELRASLETTRVPADLADLGPSELAPVVQMLRDRAATVPLARDAVAPLSAVLDALDAPLRVAVLGEFNAGKSTLVNAWLSEPVVETGVLPTTAHLNVVRYGPRRVAHVVSLEADSGVLRRREVAWSDLAGEVARAGDDVDHLEYFYPHPLLRALHFVDTPGFNAAVEGHEEIATRMLTRADAVLWMVDTNQALSASQRGLLEQIEGAREKVVVVLNKVDGLSEDEVAEVLGYLRRNVGELVRAILPLSALRAYQARNDARTHETPADRERLEAAHWPAFEDVLQREIIDRSTALKALEARRQLLATARGLVDTARANARRLSLLAQQMEEGAEALARARDKLVTRDVEDVVVRFREQRAVALARVAREVADARRPSGGWLSPLTLGATDLSFLLEMLTERLTRALERAREDTLEAVREPVEAALATLEWIARALAADQAAVLFRRIEAFVTEERMLRTRLDEQVIGWHRARIEGRLSGAVGHSDLAARLSDDANDAAERQRILTGVAGDPSDALTRDLRTWIAEYFDGALRLCDNVRRDIERLRLEVRYELLEPFEALVGPTDPDSPDRPDVHDD